MQEFQFLKNRNVVHKLKILYHFHSLTMKDAVVVSHGAIKALAMDLIKIGNDIRFLACGPRCGFSEIEIPANEPGSSAHGRAVRRPSNAT